MLSKKYRLTRIEIEDLKRKKIPILQGKFFGLIFQKANQEKKFGIIISNKISKKATERNRIKRSFYSALEKTLFDLDGKFLFLVKKNCLYEGTEEIKNQLTEIRKCLTK